MPGIKNIYRMTAPLGYKEGKEVGVRERIYNWLAPNEKMSDEELRLQGINPDSVLPEERPQAEGRPEGVLQGIFGELFGGRGAEGSELGRDELEGLLKSLNISLMLEQSFLGGGNAEKIKELENQIRQIELELLN